MCDIYKAESNKYITTNTEKYSNIINNYNLLTCSVNSLRYFNNKDENVFSFI